MKIQWDFVALGRCNPKVTIKWFKEYRPYRRMPWEEQPPKAQQLCACYRSGKKPRMFVARTAYWEHWNILETMHSWSPECCKDSVSFKQSSRKPVISVMYNSKHPSIPAILTTIKSNHPDVAKEKAFKLFQMNMWALITCVQCKVTHLSKALKLLLKLCFSTKSK